MNLGVRESVALTKHVLLALRGQKMAPDVLLCPGFLALPDVRKLVARSRVMLGAQNMFWEPSGAFTGEVSPTELKEVGVTHVLIGHSERRQILRETDEMIAKKVASAIENGLVPVLCVGETQEEHAAGNAEEVVLGQIHQAYSLVPSGAAPSLVYVAYEPVFAIGTGMPLSATEAVRMHASIRSAVKHLVGPGDVRVLYGGSVQAKDATSYLQEDEIDGLLVGGASLKIGELTEICSVAAQLLM